MNWNWGAWKQTEGDNNSLVKLLFFSSLAFFFIPSLNIKSWTMIEYCALLSQCGSLTEEIASTKLRAKIVHCFWTYVLVLIWYPDFKGWNEMLLLIFKPPICIHKTSLLSFSKSSVCYDIEWRCKKGVSKQWPCYWLASVFICSSYEDIRRNKTRVLPAFFLFFFPVNVRWVAIMVTSKERIILSDFL